MQIAVFANQTAGNNSEHPNPAAATVDRDKGSTSRLRQILLRTSGRVKIKKTENHHVNLLYEAFCPCPTSVDMKKPDDMVLLRTQNYQTLATIGPIPSVTQKFLVVLNAGTGTNFHCDDHLTTFLKSLVIPATTAPKIHDANDNALHIFGCLNLHVDVDRLTELFTFMMCERLAVPAILGCNFCDEMF